jgi:hypothetical protein
MIITATSTKPAIISAGAASVRRAGGQRTEQPGEAEGAHAGQGGRAAFPLKAHEQSDRCGQGERFQLARVKGCENSIVCIPEAWMLNQRQKSGGH